MFKKGLSLLMGVASLALTSCSGVAHKIEEYVLSMDYKANFRVLHLTDTHIGDKDNAEEHYKFMDLTIKDSNPDLIVVTGDLFTFTSRSTAKGFFNWLDSHGVPWTVTYGNHDEQCYFSVDWMTGYLNNFGSNCLFKDIQDDDVHGNCNFAINLKVGNSVFEQMIIMDSNRYYYGDYFGYDFFKQDQIDWYKSLVQHTKEQNGGITVPSRMFYHIPLPEINEAWDEAEKGTNPLAYHVLDTDLNKGVKRENPCPPDRDLGFFDIIHDLGSTRSMLFGHDHINNFIVNYKGIDFAYGIKATNRIYYDNDLLGGRTMVIHPDHSVSYESHYHRYEEVK